MLFPEVIIQICEKRFQCLQTRIFKNNSFSRLFHLQVPFIQVKSHNGSCSCFMVKNRNLTTSKQGGCLIRSQRSIINIKLYIQVPFLAFSCVLKEGLHKSVHTQRQNLLFWLRPVGKLYFDSEKAIITCRFLGSRLLCIVVKY